MEKYFANYNQALALKELGFDEPCFAGYRDSEWIGTGGPNSRYFHAQLFSNHQFDDDQKEYCSAPLKSQVFEWFREKHNLVIEPCVPFQRTYQTEDDYFEILEFGYRIFEFDQFRGGRRNTIEWDGCENKLEETSESACIDKLIEIVKNK